jgi:hypothetical protein
MANLLSNVRSGGILLPTRTVAYGIDGIGKTSFAAQAEKPVFVPTEDGCNRIDIPQFPIAKSWDEVFDNLRALASEQHDYKTCVIDTIDWAQQLAVAGIIEKEYKGEVDSYEAYGRGYKVLAQEWRKFLSALDFLRTKKSMEIILLAHATVKTFNNPNGDNFDQYKATLLDSPSTSIWGMTKEWADIVLFMHYKIIVKKDNVKDKKGKGIMSGGGKRVCYAQPAAAYDAKVRAGWTLPDEFDLDYKTYRKLLDGKKINTVEAA